MPKERISEEVKASTLGKISTSTDLASAVAEADLIIEAATENLDLKLKIFEDIDKAAPVDCILATNTSSNFYYKDCCFDISPRESNWHALHMNPVPIMKLVENY